MYNTHTHTHKHTHMYETHVNYTSIIHIYNTCVQYLRVILVCKIRWHQSFTTQLYNTCAIHKQRIRKQYSSHRIHAHIRDTCAIHMQNTHLQTWCTILINGRLQVHAGGGGLKTPKPPVVVHQLVCMVSPSQRTRHTILRVGIHYFEGFGACPNGYFCDFWIFLPFRPSFWQPLVFAPSPCNTQSPSPSSSTPSPGKQINMQDIAFPI